MDASSRSPSLARSPGLVSVHGPRSSVCESYSTTIKCIVGSGVLSLPYAIACAGWLAGSVGLALMALFGYLTMRTIIDAVHLARSRLRRHKVRGGSAVRYGVSSGYYGSDERNEPSPDVEVEEVERTLVADPDLDTVGFTTVAGVCYGRMGRRIVDAVLVFAQMGCGTAFLSLVLTSVQAVFASYGVQLHLAVVACGVFPLVILLAMPRSTTYLAPAAHLGNGTLLVCVGTLVYYGLTQPESHFTFARETLTSLPAYSGSLHGLLLFVGICAFSFAAHAEIVVVEADARSRRTYAVVLPLAILTIAVLYVSVGAFVFACFREQTHPNALLNLGDQIYVNIVRIAMSLTLIVNYPLAVLPAAQALDLLLLGPAPISPLPHQHEEHDDRVRAVRLAAAAARRAAAADGESQPLISAPRPHAAAAAAVYVADSNNPFESNLSDPRGAGEVPSGLNVHHWPADSPQAVLLGANGAGVLPPRPLPPSSSPSSSTPLSEEELEERQKRVFWYTAKGNVIRVMMCVMALSIAASVHNLGVLLSFVGSVAGGFLCFTLPPLLWLKLCQLEGRHLGFISKLSLIVQVLAGLGLIAAGLAVIVLQPGDQSTGADAAAAGSAPAFNAGSTGGMDTVDDSLTGNMGY